MNKEKINVIDLATNAKYPDDKNLSIDDWDACKLIQREEHGFDAEKGFIDYKIVVQRLSDNKFFKFNYTQYGHSGSDILEQTAIECEEKEKIVKYYE
jgi:V8-like Glu-specific endopeptidase